MEKNLRTPIALVVCASLALGIGFHLHSARVRAESPPHADTLPERDIEPRPSVTPPALVPEDAEFLRSIRAQIGSIVPEGGFLDQHHKGNRGADSAALLEDGVESQIEVPSTPSPVARLPANDELAIAIREMEQRVERRARHEAAQGNWDLGIALHQLAVRMHSTVSGPKSVP
ncbi:MAG: hypothetical protein O2931_07610 [Planctomycetota bacterium]|nr:hypothetical protein [Planctomycetota bacterium]MDA1178647.1 hypothetical protein [Planctomycetota bacterium]